MSVISKLICNAQRAPHKIAFHTGETSISYSDLIKCIRLTARKLFSMGICIEDNVVILANNTHAFIYIYFALHLIGARAIIVASDADDTHKKYVLTKTSPVLQIENCPLFVEDIHQFKQFKGNFSHPNNFADIIFTSGTTDEPKGVALTHGQITLAVKHIIKHIQNTDEDVELLLMGLSHSFGMARMRTTLYAGGTLVLGAELKKIKTIFKAIEVYQVTGFGLVPAAWRFLITLSKKSITRFADQIKYIELGSAPFSAEEKQEIAAWFPNTRIFMHYGLTEASRAVFTDLHHDDPCCVGVTSQDTKICILDEFGEPALDNIEGEIAVKTPWMISEYYQNPALTHASFSDGFLKTGDLGKLQNGRVYLTGRLKEIINVGGKKVSPQQVEKVLLQSPLITECVCVALEDPNMGEVVQAFIVPKAHNSLLNTQNLFNTLRALAATDLPVHMRPQRYQCVELIPKTASGKVQRLKFSEKKRGLPC